MLWKECYFNLIYLAHTASKAIDCLLESKWSSEFPSRESVVDFMHTMLIHKLFHRAQKVIISTDDIKVKDSSSSKVKSSSSATTTNTTTTATNELKKKKKKVKLDMHQEQIFVDGSEPYVWIYEPTPLKAWLFGLAIVVGSIVACLFPLWPRSVRSFVYYLSVAAAGFLLFIIGLAIIRFVIFSIVWAVTFGKHHLWILPNLTEDVGFFASFWPLYAYEYRGPGSENDADNGEKDITSPSESNANEDETRKSEDEAVESVDDSEAAEMGDKKSL